MGEKVNSTNRRVEINGGIMRISGIRRIGPEKSQDCTLGEIESRKAKSNKNKARGEVRKKMDCIHYSLLETEDFKTRNRPNNDNKKGEKA